MWRQVKNSDIDQAINLQNIVFIVATSLSGDGNQQKGIFMDNGSGGWL
jgi:hypothetical protein